MFPLGHFVVAAVPAVSYLMLQDRRLPGLQAVFVIGVGSQFPDLIDKPLSHLVFLLPPGGRIGAHSLPIAIPISVITLYVAWKLNRARAGEVFVFTYGVHIIADYRELLVPGGKAPAGLLWPLVPAPPGRVEPWWAGPDSINVKLWSLFSALVLVVGIVRLWTVYRFEFSNSKYSSKSQS